MSGDETPAVEVLIRRLPEGGDLPVPKPATALSAGLDLRACVDRTVLLAPGDRTLVPTGIAMALPPGHEGQVRPRSGLAVKHGLTVLNSPGTIDADYRGEVRVALINLGQEVVRIERGDRIAQLVIQRVPTIRVSEVDSLTETARGAGGFGHTGER